MDNVEWKEYNYFGGLGRKVDSGMDHIKGNKLLLVLLHTLVDPIVAFWWENKTLLGIILNRENVIGVAKICNVHVERNEIGRLRYGCYVMKM